MLHLSKEISTFIALKDPIAGVGLIRIVPANQTNIYKPGPGLPLNVIAELKPVYKRLSEDDLLARCLDGKTQNQNESLNGMIWERVPKDGSETLQLGVYDAVAHFNIGSQAAVNILHQLGLEPGEFCLEEFKMADNLRIQKGNVKATEESKKRRKILRAQRKRKGDKAQENEGVTYAAGAF